MYNMNPPYTPAIQGADLLLIVLRHEPVDEILLIKLVFAQWSFDFGFFWLCDFAVVKRVLVSVVG